MGNKVITLKVGKEDYPTNCYIVYDNNKNSVIIDPGFNSEKIMEYIKKNNLNVGKIILTHCHADHTSALDEILAKTDAKVYIHEEDLNGITDIEKSYSQYLGLPRQSIDKNVLYSLKDGDIVEEGDLKFEIIHTPGHTKGSIVIYEKDLNVLFTGDTIFHNCYGRCDLLTGSEEDMGKSIEKIFNRFENIVIYPGHEEKANIDDIKKKIRLLYRIKNN